MILHNRMLFINHFDYIKIILKIFAIRNMTNPHNNTLKHWTHKNSINVSKIWK